MYKSGRELRGERERRHKTQVLRTQNSARNQVGQVTFGLHVSQRKSDIARREDGGRATDGKVNFEVFTVALVKSGDDTLIV
jgi:hypothetical protein